MPVKIMEALIFIFYMGAACKPLNRPDSRSGLALFTCS